MFLDTKKDILYLKYSNNFLNINDKKFINTNEYKNINYKKVRIKNKIFNKSAKYKLISGPNKIVKKLSKNHFLKLKNISNLSDKILINLDKEEINLNFILDDYTGSVLSIYYKIK